MAKILELKVKQELLRKKDELEKKKSEKTKDFEEKKKSEDEKAKLDKSKRDKEVRESLAKNTAKMIEEMRKKTTTPR